MSSFRDPAAAVLSTIEVSRRTGEIGLPPAHAGIAVGPVIFQDGDYYGRTVTSPPASRASPNRVRRSWMLRSCDWWECAMTSISAVSATSL